MIHRAGAEGSDSLRSFFPGGGVMIARNAPGQPAFGVALKGGNNDEPHNHNDVGSFSVVAGGQMVICDPGGEVYTKRTFGPHRYDSKVLNSFGHATPIIAGQLERTGAEARGVIRETNFTSASDTFGLDMRSAYGAPELQELERTFVFQRGPRPALEVRDTVKFSSPQTFETTLITWGQTKAVEPAVLEIADGRSRVRVTIDTGGRAFQWRQEQIEEDVEARRKPFHVGIRLTEPVSEAVVRLRIEPAE